MIWVVTADSSCCRIYFYKRNPPSLKLINEIYHPEIRLKKSEFLTSDKPGHYQAGDAARGAYSPHTDPKEVAIIDFSREIAQILDQGRKEKLYKKLIIIAPPHINGLILQHLNKNVVKLLVSNIQKDYLHTTQQDLLKYLHENIFNLNVDF